MKQVVEKSRYLALLGVIGLLVAALATFLWGFFSTFKLIYDVFASGIVNKIIIVDLIKLVDFFLIATTLLIVAASLYELFIAEINVPDWMIAHNLYELKAKLSSMIVLVMAVKFLEDLFLLDDSVKLMQTGIAIAVMSAALIAFSYFGKKE